jgi:hypothetical protein
MTPTTSTPRRGLRLGAVIAVAVAVGIVVWLVLRDSGSKVQGIQPTGPRQVSAKELGDAARSWGKPLYWAGDIKGRKIELTRTAKGQVYVRYLPEAVPIGASPPYLTVATYPFPNAYGALSVVAQNKGNTSKTLSGGALFEETKGESRNVHFAFPGANIQVEVFDPVKGVARKLVLSGKVQPLR